VSRVADREVPEPERPEKQSVLAPFVLGNRYVDPALGQHVPHERLGVTAESFSTQYRDLEGRFARETGCDEVLREYHGLVDAGTMAGNCEVDGDTMKPGQEAGRRTRVHARILS
jgi:hypothetical protein